MRKTWRSMRSLAVVALAATASACGRDEGERVPLGAARAATGEMSGTLSGAARAALDEGNAAFRARRYPDALAAYRRAAQQSPQDVAPLWGIQMAARALGDSALADSAVRRMGELSPGTPAATGRDPHAAPGSSSLPPDHPPLDRGTRPTPRAQ